MPILDLVTKWTNSFHLGASERCVVLGKCDCPVKGLCVEAPGLHGEGEELGRDQLSAIPIKAPGGW